MGILLFVLLAAAGCAVAPVPPRTTPASFSPRFSVPSRLHPVVASLAYDRFKIAHDRNGWLVGRRRVTEQALSDYLARPPFDEKGEALAAWSEMAKASSVLGAYAYPALNGQLGANPVGAGLVLGSSFVNLVSVAGMEAEGRRLNQRLAQRLGVQPQDADLGFRPPLPMRPGEVSALLQTWGLGAYESDRSIRFGTVWQIGDIDHEPDRVLEHMERWNGSAEAQRLRSALRMQKTGQWLLQAGAVAAAVGVVGAFYQIFRYPAPPENWPVGFMAGGVALGLASIFPAHTGRAEGRRAAEDFNRRVAVPPAFALPSSGNAAGPNENASRDNANSDDYRQLGYQRLQAHDNLGALKAYEQALAKDPADASLRRTVELLRQSQAAPAVK